MKGTLQRIRKGGGGGRREDRGQKQGERLGIGNPIRDGHWVLLNTCRDKAVHCWDPVIVLFVLTVHYHPRTRQEEERVERQGEATSAHGG